MAFNLKKVLKALLLSSNQPLSPKDIQAAFTRFHDRAWDFASGTESDEGKLQGFIDKGFDLSKLVPW